MSNVLQTAASRDGLWRRGGSRFGLPACALLAALLAVATSRFVYRNRPLTTDENSYVFQANNFLDGLIARPAPAFPGAFHHLMIISDSEAGWLSRYPPGHSIWLAPGVAAGWPRGMQVLGAALGIVLAGAIGARLGQPALLPALLLLCSPFYSLIFGSLLSHTSGFLAVAAMLLFYIRWIGSMRPTYAALAGLFWGVLLLNRTWTAALVAAPFGLDALLTLAWRRSRICLIGCGSFAGVAGLFALLYRAYNKLATGSSRMPTYLYYDPSQSVGFGLRHTRGLPINHTIELGLSNLFENLTHYDWLIWGFRGGLIAALLLAFIGWNRRWTPLLLGAALSVWLGYVAFWFPGIEQLPPLYLFETFIYIAVAAAFGAQALWRRCARFPRLRGAGAILLALLCVIAATPNVRAKIVELREFTRKSRLLDDLIHSVPPRSLVLLGNLPEPARRDNLLNPRGLYSDPLVVSANGFWNDALVGWQSNRTAFVIDSIAPPVIARHVPRATVQFRLDTARMPYATGETEPAPEGDGWRRLARSGKSAPGLLVFGRYPWTSPGAWTVSLNYSIADVDPEAPVRFEIAADRGKSILASIALHGTTNSAKAVLTFSVNDVREIEPRVWYGGSGDVVLNGILVEEDSARVR